MILAGARVPPHGAGRTWGGPCAYRGWRGWLSVRCCCRSASGRAGAGAGGDRGGRPAPAGRPAVRRRPLPRGARGLSPRRDARRDPGGVRPRARPVSSSRSCASAPSVGALADAADLPRAPIPTSALLTAVHGDALWSCGMFEEAEARVRRARCVSTPPSRVPATAAPASLSTRNQLAEAMDEAQVALRLSPRDPEFHTPSARSIERMHRYEEAAAAYGNYVNLLPDRDRSDKRAVGARDDPLPPVLRRARCRSTSAPTPEERVWTRAGPHDRRQGDRAAARSTAVSRGLRARHRRGADGRSRARSRAAAAWRRSPTPRAPASAMSASAACRSAASTRFEIGGMKIRNVPALIKNPPLGDHARARAGQLLAAGARPVDAHRLPPARADHEPPAAGSDATRTQLPLRMHRLATVRGTVNGNLPASFVVDTGGEVISISGATADLMVPPNPYRRIPLKVYGTSGWDKDAFLMPVVDLAFNEHPLPAYPGRRAQPARAQRPARLPARGHRRPQVPEPLHASRST